MQGLFAQHDRAGHTERQVSISLWGFQISDPLFFKGSLEEFLYAGRFLILSILRFRDHGGNVSGLRRGDFRGRSLAFSVRGRRSWFAALDSLGLGLGFRV